VDFSFRVIGMVLIVLPPGRYRGGTAAAAPPPSGLATLPSVGAVP